tara:strand:- start:1776 stop:3755 length:1980 start_codon:yes stop_codon:yes gene_type:complete
MATFLDIFNKKTAIEKQASDAEFAYEETKLQDTLAKQKGWADVARMAVSAGKMGAEASATAKAEQQTIEDTGAVRVETPQTFPGGREKPFAKDVSYSIEHGESGQVVSGLSMADLKAISQEAKINPDIKSTSDLLFQQDDATKEWSIRDAWKTDTDSMGGIEQRMASLEAVLSQDKYKGVSGVGVDAWTDAQGYGVDPTYSSQENIIGSQLKEERQYLGDIKRGYETAGDILGKDQYTVGDIKSLYEGTQGADYDMTDRFEYLKAMKTMDESDPTYAAIRGSDYKEEYGDVSSLLALSDKSLGAFQDLNVDPKQFDPSARRVGGEGAPPTMPVEGEDEFYDEPIDVDMGDDWQAPAPSVSAPGTLEEFEQLKSNIAFDQSAWDAMDSSQKFDMLQSGEVFVPDSPRQSFLRSETMKKLGGETGQLSVMDAVDQDASSFASDIVTKLLGAEELSKDWAQSLGYSRAPGDSPLFDEKYGATADVDAMLKGSTEVVGGGGMADYRERTDKEYADYRKIMNTKMDIEDPSALAQDIGASPIDRYLQGDKIPAPIKQYEEEFKAHEFDLSKPLEAVETQSQHIPDMTQKRNYGPNDWSAYFNKYGISQNDYHNAYKAGWRPTELQKLEYQNNSKGVGEGYKKMPGYNYWKSIYGEKEAKSILGF